MFELLKIDGMSLFPGYLNLYRELDRELALFSSKRKNRSGKDWNQEVRKHLERIELLSNEVKKPALAAEVAIWRELMAAKSGGMGVEP